MRELNQLLLDIDSWLGGAQWFIFLLLGMGLFFTIYLKFPQIRYFKFALRAVRGKYDEPGEKGDTSHFQALTTALSGTVGTGNIAGVAFAIFLGGPAALFWMLITALLGMTTKFVEVTLSHKYREIDAEGYIAGGPMYYMKNKLNAKWLAVIFSIMAIFCSFGTGNFPQINSISNSVFSTFGISKVITGGVLTVFLAIVILGGIKRIAKVTERLVPFMAIVYFIGAICVILYNYQNIIPSIVSVFADVFTGTAAAGGFIGASFAWAFNRGVNRGLFSNEAGQGSAPIAHAAARTKEPVSEGLVAILEPFIDTIIICSITGLTILSSGVWKEKHENVFQESDMAIIQGNYSDQNEEDVAQLFNYFSGKKTNVNDFSGQLKIEKGVIKSKVTVLNCRSVAEDVLVYNEEDILFSGNIKIDNGIIVGDVECYFKGKSLMHSAPLTAEAFTRSVLGDYGKWVVSLGLLLFAFSTAIAWSYYGGRSVTFLFGVKAVLPYRIIYCIGFFIASFIDTTLIWSFSGVAIALMTIPNLLGIFVLRKDMKQTVNDFWDNMKIKFPDEKIPF